jgi:ABC-type sugar transport system permease subunit
VNVGDFLLGALDFVSAVVLSAGLAAGVAYLVWARLSDHSGAVATPAKRLQVVGGFTATAVFIFAWALLNFEQANLLLAFVIAVVAGAAVWALSRALPDAKAPTLLQSPTAIVIGLAYGALLLWGSLDVDRVGSTMTAVFVAVFVSAALFIGVNRLFDLAPTRWAWFLAAVLGGMTLIVYAILWGNRVIEHPLVWTVVATIVGTATGYLLGANEAQPNRLVIGGVGGAVLGLLVGLNMRKVFLIDPGTGAEFPTPIPQLDPGIALLWLAIGAAIGLVIWQLRGRSKSPLRAASWWATAGWFIGALVVPNYNSGAQNDGILATTVLGALVGLSLALSPLRDERGKRRIEQGSRKYIFLTPALFFIAASLLVPTVRTAWLSFLDRRGIENVGFQNYIDVFTDANIINFDNWTGIFGSRMTWVGIVIIGLGVLAALMAGRRTGGTELDFSPGTIAPIAIGIFLIVFAVFTSIRGTISNNLWWVFAVTIIATSLGLAIAVLADRGSYENIAKSLIFMPMAISFVGAGIIWRFMYIARPPGREQTGVLNSLWVWLGQVSNSNRGTTIAIIVLAVVILALLYLAYRGWRADANGVMIGSIVMAIPFAWMIYKFAGPGLGGFTVFELADGSTRIDASPIFFTSEVPFNNLWLMVVLIWIQTGFAMVIFSAAVKGVPAALLEAAKVDGATESQSFWRVTIPQIAPTIGVVVTTLIVTVMKVFDIVRVMTAGNFDTNVIANEMYDKAFTEFNFGVGSALAIVLFLAILPIMFYNIRRMQKAAV